MIDVKIFVEDEAGNRAPYELPTDMNLNLMEALKAHEFPILATCGGMALCATCHIQVLEGADALNEPQDAELDMLDNLVSPTDSSRLSCQIPVTADLEGLVIRIKGDQ